MAWGPWGVATPKQASKHGPCVFTAWYTHLCPWICKTVTITQSNHLFCLKDITQFQWIINVSELVGGSPSLHRWYEKQVLMYQIFTFKHKKGKISKPLHFLFSVITVINMSVCGCYGIQSSLIQPNLRGKRSYFKRWWFCMNLFVSVIGII